MRATGFSYQHLDVVREMRTTTSEDDGASPFPIPLLFIS